MEHVRKGCGIKGCGKEANYWMEAREKFVETLLEAGAPDTFYLCAAHRRELMSQGGPIYHHLDFETCEILTLEVGKYARRADRDMHAAKRV